MEQKVKSNNELPGLDLGDIDKTLVNRLKRAQGHLQKVIEMAQHNEKPINTVQQLQAVVNALISAKRNYIQDQSQYILQTISLNSENDAEVSSDQAMANFREITKYI
jgi:DNA-binding FrmR family transcriptional regulator